MHRDDQNIVLFPKWKNTLKEESLQDIQAKRYGEALEKLDELIHYNVQDHDILIGKMMCLMELGRYQEAEYMCEEIIQYKQDEHYFHYVHIYLTILFQSNKYNILMERIEEELSSPKLPTELREQFTQLYEISEKMELDLIEKKSSVYVDELLDAVSDSDYKKQWRNLMKLKNMKVEPDSMVIPLLEREDVHPVLKTAIFMWLQEQNYSNVVKVYKHGQELQLRPADIPGIKELELFKEVMFHLRNIEQNNPTMNMFLEDSLYRYLYVNYPILPSSDDAELIATTLEQMSNVIINENYQASADDRVQYYMEEINHAEHLYLSIIEE